MRSANPTLLVVIGNNTNSRFYKKDTMLALFFNTDNYQHHPTMLVVIG
jgi:hypothetical protein